MMVVIAITAMVGMVLTWTIQFFYKSNAFLLEQTVATENARKGITDAIKVIREMSYGDDGSYPLASIGTATITFFADLDNDLVVERVKYVLLEEVLYRETTNSAGYPPSYVGQPQSTTTIATYVKNTELNHLFSYYNTEGTLLPAIPASIASVSSVRVTFLVDINPLRAPNIFTLTQTATLRNLRSE